MGLTKDYATTLKEWLSQFSAVYRTPVVEDEDYPTPSEYITYSSFTGNFSTPFIQAITVYSKSTGYTYIMNIVDAIENAITEHGTVIRKDWGYIRIEKGSPFYQDKQDEDDDIRAGYINLQVTIYQKHV